MNLTNGAYNALQITINHLCNI